MDNSSVGHDVSKQTDKDKKTVKKSFFTRLQHLQLKRDDLFAVGDLRSTKARGWTEKLLTRSMSGAIYALIIVICLYLGPLATALLVSAMSWLCCSEFFRMMRIKDRRPSEFIGLAVAAALPIAALLPSIWTSVVLFGLVIAVGIWFIMTPTANIADVALTVFGPLYTSLLFTSIVLIRNYNPGNTGAFLTFAVMGSIWVNDAMAYLVGVRFGQHKLAPTVSPNKSWEGFWGGICGSIIIWLVIWGTQVVPISFYGAVLSGIVVGISGVLGDLFESRIKRGAGVKDSGDLIPGHGGLLDRSDSMLFGSMAAHFILVVGGLL